MSVSPQEVVLRTEEEKPLEESVPEDGVCIDCTVHTSPGTSEIKLKAEEMKPISNFFTKKAIKSEEVEESKPHIETKDEEHTKNYHTKSVKEEPKTKPHVETNVEEHTNYYHPKSLKEEPETMDQDNDEKKPHVSELHCKEANNVPVKRDYEEFSVDRKQSVAEANPPKKKGNAGSAGYHQPVPVFGLVDPQLQIHTNMTTVIMDSVTAAVEEIMVMAKMDGPL